MIVEGKEKLCCMKPKSYVIAMFNSNFSILTIIGFVRVLKKLIFFFFIEFLTKPRNNRQGICEFFKGGSFIFLYAKSLLHR